MRVLMFGWEFSARSSGGIGPACRGITDALSGMGHEVILVFPRSDTASGTGNAGSREMEVRPVPSPLTPYQTPASYLQPPLREEGAADPAPESGYGPDLLSEVIRYGEEASWLARDLAFDVIHAHDWMTAFAAVRARETSGRPLVFHFHSLEFNRRGEDINRNIFEIERYGMERADHVIAVSAFLKNMIVSRYGIPTERVTVAHNAADPGMEEGPFPVRDRDGKTVLFLGRITYQKGPRFFLESAGHVLREMPEATFIMAGDGDGLDDAKRHARDLGIADRVRFPGFLEGREVENALAACDLFVLSSVSEPFGIAPLEAARRGIPVIISRQSGVAEVLKSARQFDFWDTEGLARNILDLLADPAGAAALAESVRTEAEAVRWQAAAEIIDGIYRLLPPGD
ncbi:MAG TPA: glycosyltransferase family 4 protein [Syntrophales bacterium]|nr:glycosyltransferase family 4 protein [Syntrophales bacterium]